MYRDWTAAVSPLGEKKPQTAGKCWKQEQLTRGDQKDCSLKQKLSLGPDK